MMFVSKPIAALSAGCADVIERGRSGPERWRAAPPANPAVQALVLDEPARIDWIEKSEVAALREGVIEKMELQIGMPVKKGGTIGSLHKKIAELTVAKAALQAKQHGPRRRKPRRRKKSPSRSWPATSGSRNGSRGWSRPRTSPRPRASSRSPRLSSTKPWKTKRSPRPSWTWRSRRSRSIRSSHRSMGSSSSE